MRNMIKTTGLAFALAILFCACNSEINEQEKSQSMATPPLIDLEQQTVERMQSYYVQNLVQGGIQNPAEYEIDGVLRGGIIPHHQLASDMMAGFYELVSENKEQYDNIIIVSPSHFPENCNSDVVTATADWESPFGVVNTNTEIVEEILASNIIQAENNPEAISLDHGVAGHIPFISRYLPDAKVSVFLLANKLSEERLTEFQNMIATITKDNRTLLIASVDCSHYLLPKEMAERDVETKVAIESFDIPRIMSFTDANVDSPQALSTLLFAAIENGWEITELDHSTSNEKLPHAITNHIYDWGMTSYFIFGATALEDNATTEMQKKE